jgi:hypothetical protein
VSSLPDRTPVPIPAPEAPATHERGGSRRLLVELAAVGAVFGVLLTIAYDDVVLRHRNLLASAYVQGVMGGRPAYGFPRVPTYNSYLVDPGASAWQWEPWTAKVSRLYLAGEPPLWNANEGFGAPLAANMQSAPYFLLELPLFLRPTPLVWNAYLLGRCLLAGVLTYALARALAVGVVGALGAGTAFMLCGYFALWLNNSWLNVDVLLPAVLLGIEQVLRRGGGWWVLGLGVVTSQTLLGGMPESTFVVLLCALAYGIVRLAVLRAAGATWGTVGRRGAVLALAAVLGVGASAVQLLPFAEYVGEATHFHTTGSVGGLGHLPWQILATLPMPFLGGPPLENPRPMLTYAGTATLTLAALALGARGAFRRWTVWFFALATAAAVGKTCGLGAINWIGALPVFNIMNYPKHVGIVTCLGLAMLAGFGLDALARGRLSPTRALATTSLVQAVMVVLLLGYTDWLAGSVRADTFRAACTTAVVALLAIQAGCLLLRWPGTGPIVGAWAAAVLIAELLWLVPEPKRPRRFPADAEPPAVRHVRAQGGVERTFGVEGVLYPNTATYFGLQDIRAVDGIYPARWMTYVREFVNPSVHDRYTGGMSSGPKVELPTRCMENPWFDLTGVGWLFSHGTGPAGQCEREDFITDVLRTIGQTPTAHRTGFVIDGRDRAVLFHHPPSELRIPLRPEAGRHVLAFSLALDPKAWKPWRGEKGDGVRYGVAVEADGTRVPLYSRWIDPKNDARDRRWVDGSVDLQRWVGREIHVLLSADGGTSTMWDHGGWGDLRLGTGDGPTSHYAVEWDPPSRWSDLSVFRNERALPRAFAVPAAEAAADAADAVARMQRAGFDPRRRVVLEAPPEALAPLRDAPPATLVPARILEYGDHRVVVESETAGPAVLVLTDLFYPGWTATLDGVPATIHPADLAFRGVLVPAGTHRVEFTYAPRSFTLGLLTSALSLAGLLGLALGTLRAAAAAT